MDDRLTHYTQRIRDACPDLDVVSLRLIGQGQNNDVVLVKEDMIFRFPRYEEGIVHLDREVRVLRALQGRVPLPIPHPAYVSLTPRTVGQMFMGYPIVRGTPLRRETLATMDRTEVGALGTQLGQFLRCLHDVPLEQVFSETGQRRDPTASWDNLYLRIQQHLFPYMHPDARCWTIAHFETFLHNPRNRGIAPALVHGDFGAENLLYDWQQHALVGVIDFSAAGPNDPAVDFAAVSTLRSDMLDTIATVYPDVQTALERVAFYKGTFALQEALFGLENGDEEAFHAGIDGYL